MLRSMMELINYDLLALDGEIGQVYDFYFDDKTWTIRYLVADTGKWLPGRKVLISPEALERPDWVEEEFPIRLNRDQIEDSPSIAVDKPVSNQYELELRQFYGWSPYWRFWAQKPRIPTQIYNSTPANDLAIDPEEADKLMSGEAHDPHLRSFNEIDGYHIEAIDGEIGHVEDLIIDDSTWQIRHIVVDTRNLWPGKEVLLSPAWIDAVIWHDSIFKVDLHKQTIKDSPEYDPSEPVNRSYEEILYDYYGRPYYWTTEGELEPVS